MSDDALHNLCRADPVWAERYEGWSELGHGASATVVRTHGKALGEDLALKVFPHLSREEWARFRQEVSTAQKLTSPYIVRTYSPFPRGGFAWIELELIDGATLRHELDRRAAEGGRFTLAEAAEIGAAVAEALCAAHAAGVTHRDVKPANILLPRGGRPPAKLGDFGISRLSGAARLTSTGLLVGTPQFAAPEVAGGERAEPPSDVYSFALCLYLMLSGGRPPFAIEDEGAPTQWLRAHTEQRPRPITDHESTVPARLASLIERALDKNPARRPTAEEALAVLRTLREDEASAAATAPIRRRRGSVLAGGGAALAAAAALALWAHGGGRPVPATTAAPAPVAARLPQPSPPPATVAAAVAPLAARQRAAAPPAQTPPPAVSPRSPAPEPAAVVLEAVMPSLDDPPPEATASTPPAPPDSPSDSPPETAEPPSPKVPAGAPADPAATAAAPPAAGTALHLEGLLRARPVAVGRHEGLPGQREMVLVDALHGEEWIWFRFRLEGGASLRLARVSSERGEITTYVQEPAGADLRVVVQVPRAAVTRSSRLRLEVADGPTYAFALGSRSIGRFLKDLFK
jgi:hypothetical protein